MTLKDKAISGASWSLVGNIAQSATSFIIGIVLARLLTPEEYGLVGMAGVFIFVTYVFVESGFSAALIQKDNCTNSDYSTIFYFNLIISVFFFTVLFFSAGAIADFYSEPELKEIIRVLSVLIIFYALSIVHRSIIVRNINFKLLNIIITVSQVSSGIIGILLAYSGFGVWSLVWKTVLNQLFINIQLWIFNKWYPSLEFDFSSLKKMFGFSYKLLLSGIINKTYEQLYNLIIGKFFSAKELGLYTRANQFKSLPSESLSGAIMGVSFPVFAQVKNDPIRFKNIAKKIIRTTMFVNISAMLGMAAISKYLIITLIGDKWIDATIYLQLLCVVGLFYPLHPINLNIITATGRSDLFLKLEIIKKILAIPIIILGILTSVKIMIIGMIFSSIVSIFINGFYTKQLIDYGVTEQLKDISGSLALGIVTSTIVYFLGACLAAINAKLIILLIQVFAGIVLVICFSSIFKMNEYSDLKDIIKKKLLRE